MPLSLAAAPMRTIQSERNWRFFLLAADVGEFETALHGFLRCLVELGFGEEVTAGSLEDLFAAVIAFCATFYAGHGWFSFRYCVMRLEVGSTSSLAVKADRLVLKTGANGPNP